MYHNRITCLSFTAALLASLLLAAAPAVANEQRYVEEDGNAITLCRGALPTYETSLRSRPLAIVNEGDRSSYVNCGWRAPTNSKGQDWVMVVIANLGVTPQEISCTGIFGKEDSTGNDYIQKSVWVPRNGTAAIKWYYQQDNNGQRWQTNSSVQCLLPPGFGIARTPQGYWQK